MYLNRLDTPGSNAGKDVRCFCCRLLFLPLSSSHARHPPACCRCTLLTPRPYLLSLDGRSSPVYLPQLLDPPRVIIASIIAPSDPLQVQFDTSVAISHTLYGSGGRADTAPSLLLTSQPPVHSTCTSRNPVLRRSSRSTSQSRTYPRSTSKTLRVLSRSS